MKTILSIIILSYNTKDLIIKCLESIADKYKKQLEENKFEIIVFDNASTDDSVLAISNLKSQLRSNRSQIVNIKLTQNKENLGFAKGNNLAAKEAEGKYLLFLNSDTEVLDEGLVQMTNFLEDHKEVGVLGAKLINEDKTEQKSAGKFYNLLNSFLMLFGGERLGLLRFSPKKETVVDWVSGAAMMVRKDLFERLGGFEERLFMYIEDMEFCFRVKKDKQKVFFYPYAKIVHKERKSSNREYAIIKIHEGLLFFYRKHKSKLSYLILKYMLISKSLISIFIGTVFQKNYLVNTYRKTLKL